MIKVEENKHYHFELYEGKGFNAKVLEIKDVKIKLSNKETIEYKDIKNVLEYWPYEEPEPDWDILKDSGLDKPFNSFVTMELTFEDLKKLANENGWELRQYGDGTRTTLYKTFPRKKLKKLGLEKPLEFKTLQEVAAYFSPF